MEAQHNVQRGGNLARAATVMAREAQHDDAKQQRSHHSSSGARGRSVGATQQERRR